MTKLAQSYPLTPVQEGMLFHTLLAPTQGIYFEQRWCLLHGDLDIQAFVRAWQFLTARHDVLRTRLQWQDVERALQIVESEVELPFAEEDWREFSQAEQTQRWEAFLAAERQAGFELTRAPLMRCALFRQDTETYRFVWSYHHILMDGWCNGLLIAELNAIYRAFSRGGSVDLPPPIPYRLYVDWLAAQDFSAAERYWREQLSGATYPTSLGFARTPPGARPSGRYCECESVLSAELGAALNDFARRRHLTMNTIMQGVWALWLARCAETDDVVFGTAVGNRPPDLEQAERMIGLFISTVPVRVNIDDAADIVSWLQTLQEAQRTRERYGYCAISEIQRWCGVSGGSTLFESILVFENYPLSASAALNEGTDGLAFSNLGGYERSHYPLALMVMPERAATGTDTLRFCLRYDHDYLSEAVVARLWKQLDATMRSFVAADDNCRVGAVAVIDEEEWRQQRTAGRGPVVTVPGGSVAAKVGEHAQAHPHDPALTFVDAQGGVRCMTYQTLYRRVQYLSAELNAAGVTAGARVGIHLTRSADLPSVLLAVMHIGACYVPMDTDYPAERLAFVARDADLALLVHDGLSPLLSDLLPVSLALADNRAWPLTRTSEAIDAVAVRDEDLAYIIYTSGSTGLPKGVAVTHANLNNFLTSMRLQPGCRQDDRVLALTTIAFDIAALEFWLPLVCGAQLILVGSEVSRDAEKIVACIENFDVTVMQATPSTWRLLVEFGWKGRQAGLKMLSGGEALDPDLASGLSRLNGELWNLYGPTETTVWSSALRLTEQHLQGGTVPIGGSVANTFLYVLDSRLRPLPTGAAGQLYIGGLGLARGYCGRADLTAASFLPSPWPEGGQRLYRSGDRVRWREDGLLEFLGRDDKQVKLRGYRIELGEIEALLANHAPVCQAVVELRGDAPTDQALAAYLVLSSAADVQQTIAELRAQASDRLPVYMRPVYYVVLDAMPLTANGKIARARLPAPTAAAKQRTAADNRLTDEQALIAGVWAQALNFPATIGLHDDFFLLGGHSLAAMRISARLQELLGGSVPLALLFEHPRLQDYCDQVYRVQGKEHSEIIPLVPRAGLLPVSWAQRRQWLIARLDPANTAYTIPVVLELTGDLDTQALQWSFDRLTERHECLRTAFADVDGEPRLWILDTLQPVIDTEDYSGLSQPEQQNRIDDIVRSELGKPFDLSAAPLWRVRLLRITPQRHVLILTLHHSIVDDWSLGILVRELGLFFVSYGETAPGAAELPPMHVQYADIAAWQRQSDFSAELSYWHAQLQDLPPPLTWPEPGTDTARKQGACVSLSLDQALTEQVSALGRSCGATLFMTLLAGFYILLMRYTGCRDLLVGSPVASRDRAEVQGVVGLLVNTLLLRANLTPGSSVSELLQQVRRTALAAYRHQNLPFEQLIDAVPELRSRHGEPLQVMFALQGAPLETLELPGLRWSSLPTATASAKFQLSLSLRQVSDESGTKLNGVFEYQADLFSPLLMQRMVRHYEQILRQMTAFPQQCINELTMLSEPEREQLQRWGRGAEAMPQDSVPAAFSKMAAAYPQIIAVTDGGLSYSYLELEVITNRLAHELLARGISAETPVGLWSVRCVDTIIAMLAILKAGGYFVPLDADMPAARLQRIVRSAAVKWIVAVAATDIELSGIVQFSLQQLTADSADRPDTAPDVDCSPDQLMYVMYTSGSSGEPKGVAVAHRGVLRLILQADYVDLNSETVMLHAAPLPFDASTFEIWGALLSGGRLVIQRESCSALASTAALIRRQGINTVWLTAGLFRVMVDEHLETLTQLRYCLAGGDVLPERQARLLRRAAPQLQLINGYGPTETTTFACCHAIGEDDMTAAAIPIGRPIAGTHVYVLDGDLQRLPPGVPGELFIGGLGVARGYWGRPELTAEHFLPNPFFDLADAANGDAAQVLYRSGDWVRWREDGAIEFLGRRDRQIKMRGFRIEVAEIESAMSAHPAVKAVQVDSCGTNGHSRLVAWYVGSDTVTDDAWRLFLANTLPAYMLPSAFLRMPAFPLTPNGKIDRQALPEPAPAEAGGEDDADDLERVLLAIWRDLLPIPGIGTHGNFFDYGGDSIIAMQIAGRAEQVELPLTPALIFSHQTISELATVMRPILERPAPREAAPSDLATGYLPLTPIQHWFFQLDLAFPAHFNQSVILHLPHSSGAERLEKAVAAVIERHDAFRLRFVRQGREWRQSLVEVPPQQKLETLDISGMSEAEVTATIAVANRRAQASLDLSVAPLLRVCCFDGGAQRPLSLLIVAHHLVVDVVSWHVLMDDLHRMLRMATTSSLPSSLPRASLSVWSQYLVDRQISDKDRQYWSDIVSPGRMLLPVQGTCDRNTEKDADCLTVVLEAAQTSELLQCLPSFTCGADDALLAALTEVICDWSGADSLLIDVETHGRPVAADLSAADFSRTVGWFTALYPQRFQPRQANSCLLSLQQLAAQRTTVPDAMTYGILRYLRGHEELSYETPIVFNYLGQLDSSFISGETWSWESTADDSVHPENRRSHLIAVNAWIKAGKLTMEWRFAARHLGRDCILRLAEAVRTELITLTDEALASSAGQRVSSDDRAAVLAQVSFAEDSAS